jgi:hypothetical protein
VQSGLLLVSSTSKDNCTNQVEKTLNKCLESALISPPPPSLSNPFFFFTPSILVLLDQNLIHKLMQKLAPAGNWLKLSAFSKLICLSNEFPPARQGGTCTYIQYVHSLMQLHALASKSSHWRSSYKRANTLFAVCNQCNNTFAKLFTILVFQMRFLTRASTQKERSDEERGPQPYPKSAEHAIVW